MLSQDHIVAPTQGRPPALIEDSGRKVRDRIEHFLRAPIRQRQHPESLRPVARLVLCLTPTSFSDRRRGSRTWSRRAPRRAA